MDNLVTVFLLSLNDLRGKLPDRWRSLYFLWSQMPLILGRVPVENFSCRSRSSSLMYSLHRRGLLKLFLFTMNDFVFFTDPLFLLFFSCNEGFLFTTLLCLFTLTDTFLTTGLRFLQDFLCLIFFMHT